MTYISTKEAAEKWKITQRRVIHLAHEGRIQGAVRCGKSWLIPAEAGKPTDGRATPAKAESGGISFRFPFYMNGPEEGFSPPLCEEEKALRQAQIDFLACNFENARTGFENLRKEAKSSSIRTAALFFLCYLSVNFCNGENFEAYYQLLRLAVHQEQPHRQELGLLPPYLLGCLALYKNAAENFHFDVEYEYSPSAYPLLYVLSLLTLAGSGAAGNVAVPLKTSEILSKQLEIDGHFYEAQMLHVLLFTAYYFKANEREAAYHLKKGLEIAFRQHFIYPMADIYMYYPDLFTKVLKEYPDEFAAQVAQFGMQIHQSYAHFMSKRKITDLYMELTKSEYQYVFYACEGYSNREVAEILHLSERTIANRYADIYDKLEVKGKQELVQKMKATVSKKLSSKNADSYDAPGEDKKIP